jgi:co-chaperonin GroES (HSP10)
MNVVKGKIKPIKNNILVTDMEFGAVTTTGGIYILGDDGKTRGVKPRWGRVWAIGPEQVDVEVGDWILIEHGRWTRGITVEENGKEFIIRRVDSTAIMVKTDQLPDDVHIPDNG